MEKRPSKAHFFEGNIITTIFIIRITRTATAQNGGTPYQRTWCTGRTKARLFRKYTNENGDIWSGSVVIDKHNTAGFGKNALVAVTTQPTAKTKAQEQYLWYSTDKGKTFTSYSDQPVMKNPGTKDFRDPKVIWDEQDDKWVMAMAEGEKSVL